MGVRLVDLLERFHDQGYIHCDIKPDNIMIGDYMRDQTLMNKLYLIDFGISSRFLDENNNHVPFE
jgi:serine/threonine protein kinase